MGGREVAPVVRGVPEVVVNVGAMLVAVSTEPKSLNRLELLDFEGDLNISACANVSLRADVLEPCVLCSGSKDHKEKYFYTKHQKVQSTIHRSLSEDSSPLVINGSKQ